MTERLKSIFDLFDTQGEVLAWVLLATTIFFEIRGFEDLYTLGALALAAGTMGYVKKLKAGSAEINLGDRDER